MPRVPWKIHDYSTGAQVTFEFPINPKEFNPPGRSAGVTWERTSAPNGQVIFFQNLDAPGEGSLSGYINEASLRDAIDAELSKFYPVLLEDDLANQWWVLFTSLEWTRLRRYIYPHSYEYTAKFTATRQPPPVVVP